MKKRQDLALPPSFVPNDDSFWSSSEPLEQIYLRLESQALEISNWYMSDRHTKRFWARFLRIAAIVLTMTGAPVPLLASMLPDLDSLWGYVLIGLAAGMVGIDRFFGFSSGWMRDMGAVIDLTQVVQEFRFDWADMTMNGERSHERDSGRLELLRRFSADQYRILSGETRTWAEQLRASLAEVDSRLRQGPSGQDVGD